jgi:thioredoxin 1
MKRATAVNVVLLAVVAANVAGAAWYKARRTGTAATQPSDGLPRLVDLGATECKACKALAPILEELREEYAGQLTVEFIDVWKNPEAKAPYNIRMIPTQILFDRDGRELWRHEGFIAKDDLKRLFAERVGVE